MSRSGSKLKSAREKVPSVRPDLSTVCGVSRQPFGFETEAFLGSVDHRARGLYFGLPDSTGRLHVDNDRVRGIDQIVVGIGEEGWPAPRTRPLGRRIGR